MRTMLLKLNLVVVLGLTIAAAQESTPQSGPSSAVDTSQSTDLLIGSGDLLEVSVLGAPEYKYEVRTNSKGEVVLPFTGAVRVAGLSVEGAEKAIAGRLQQVNAFNDPEVTVFEKDYATQGISVLGEVQKPGIYPLLGPHTLMDAISAAGGTTARAGNVVTIT